MPPASIKLLPKQERFIFSPARTAIYRGGVRSGKTVALTHWAAQRALKNRVVAVVEPSYSLCRDVFLVKQLETLNRYGLQENRDFYVRRSAPFEVTFRGSSGRIILRSAESPIIGFDAHDGAVDEFCFVPNKQVYLDLLQRLSNSHDAQVRLASSPVFNSWAKELEEDPQTLVLNQTLLENYFLPLAYIESLKKELGEGSKYYRQQVLGEYISMDDGIFELSKMPVIPPQVLHSGLRLVRAWDFASSAKTSADFTVGVLMSVQDGRYVIHDVLRLHGSFAAIQSQITSAMRLDPQGTQQLCESNGPGLTIISVLRADPQLANVPIVPCTASSDKVTRALPFSGAVAGGLVSIVQAPWNKAFTQELEAFGPRCEHDDQVDAAALAYNVLSKAPAKYTSFNF